MRTFKSTSVFAVVLSLLAVASSFGQFGFGPGAVTYFDFTGWDAAQVQSASGQTFMDIIPGVDVTVTGIGDFDFASGFNGSNITVGHADAGDSALLLFEFDTTMPLVIKQSTLDPQETLEVFGVGPETYSNISGAAPTQSSSSGGSGLTLQGNGFGANVAIGETLTMAQQNQPVRVTYTALANNKFEFLMVGTIVPEPNSAALLGVGAIGLLLSGRKRRRNS